MPLNDEIKNSTLKINVVVLLGGQYFARYQPDAGLILDSKFLLVDKVNFAKAILDLRDIKTSIPTDSFNLIDKDNYATEFLFAPDNRHLNTEVLIYIGLSDANFNWSDYKIVSRSIIKEINRDNNSYKISLRRNVSLTSRPIWFRYNSLAKDFSEFDTEIALMDSTLFPASGYLKVNEEVIQYTANDTATGTLSGLTRGMYGSMHDSTKVTVHGTTGHGLDGKYFLINTPTLSYAVWYFSSSGTAPGAYPNNIMVVIPSNVSASEVADRTKNAINAGVAFSATSGDDEVIITSTAIGVTTPAQDFDTGFIFHKVNLAITSHRLGEDVYSIKLVEGNPITLMLQLMISNGGHISPYSVLDFGLGINPALINIAEIEAVRDAQVTTDVYRFFIQQVSSGQEFFEKEICLPTNTRLISEDGLITLVYIDQTSLYDYIADESVIMGIPDWSVSVDKVVNRIVVNYDYAVGLDSFRTNVLFEDAPSIALYGKSEIIYSFKGIYSDINGAAIVNTLTSRLLIRLRDPRTKITASIFFSAMNVKLGDTVKLRHRYVPGAKTMGSDTDMTVLEKGIDFNTGRVSLGLYYTTISASGIKRFGVIGPSEPIVSILSQRTFNVRNGTWYAVGYRILIDGEMQTIRLLTGNTITVNVAFTTPLVIGKLVMLTVYDSATQAVHDRYAFVSPNSGNFADGEPAYQIVP